MSDFREEMRYEYPLTPESIVVDAGAYQGTFARTIFNKYGCNVLAFEPVFECRVNLGENILVVPFGIARYGGLYTFNIQLDGTGIYAKSSAFQSVRAVNLIDMLNALNLQHVDLLKLNIEGMEFEVLEDLIQRQQLTRFDNIQVQFHPVIPDAEARRNSIVKELLKTHEPTYCYPWVWENYRR
jgi:FkbM family methyltransferase